MKVLKKIAQIIGEVCSVNAGIDFTLANEKFWFLWKVEHELLSR